MKEIDEETLDAMFPRGYVIVYTCKDDQLRVSLFNPNGYRSVDQAHRLILDNKHRIVDED